MPSISFIVYWLAAIAAVAAPVAAFALCRLGWKRGWRKRVVVMAALVGIGWPLMIWSVFIEPETLVVRQVTIESPAWSGPPVRLGLIADTHVGAPHMDPARLAGIIQRMNGLDPDLVLVLGDYVGGHKQATQHSAAFNAEIRDGILAFRALKAPLGVVGVFGNHDVWYGEDLVRRALSDAHVTVLRDDAVRIRRPDGDFWIAGLADYYDVLPAKAVMPALADVPPGAPAILMAHEPDAFALDNQPYALMVAGHTHCGQIDLPVLGRIGIFSRVEHRFACHLYRRGAQALYVSAGLGVSDLPIRFNAPPEINLITLRAAGAPSAK